METPASLTLDYDELVAQVCQYLHGIDDISKIETWEQRALRRCILNGLRRFYYPAQVDPNIPWDWSFLRTDFTFITEVGVGDYIQPENFGGLIGPLHHLPGDNIRVPIIKTTWDRILSYRELNISITNWPMHYAEVPVPSGGRSSQRWQISIWPNASAVYTFKGKQRINPLAPNGEQVYLYGGPEHSQTIIESCLAAAELMKGENGPHMAEFLNCLRTSMVLDDAAHAPEFIGYNGDSRHGGPNPLMRDERHFENFAPVTMQGAVP